MIQIAQDISSRVQYKKRRRSGLRRGFLCCAIGEIDKSRCVTYFSTVPNWRDFMYICAEMGSQAWLHAKLVIGDVCME